MTMHHNNYIRQKIVKTLTYVPIIIITRTFSQNNEQGLPHIVPHLNDDAS